MTLAELLADLKTMGAEEAVSVEMNGNTYTGTAEEMRVLFLDVSISTAMFWREVREAAMPDPSKPLCSWCAPNLSGVGTTPSTFLTRLNALRRAPQE